MNDDELRAHLAAMEARILQPLNTKLDDILDKLSRQQEELHAMRGHMLYAMEDSLTMGKRITKLEDEIRHRREGK